METHMFIKYFPETKEVIKYFMEEKYFQIENISHYKNMCANDKNLETIKNGNKWFEIYFPKDFAIKTNHENLAKICECVNDISLPQNGIFAICYEKKSFFVIWPQDKTIEQKYSNFVKEHVAKNFFY